MNTYIRSFIGLSLVLTFFVVVAAPMFTSALTITIPTVSVGSESFSRTSSVRSFTRRGEDTSNQGTQEEDNTADGQQGADGADGANGGEGGTVVTGDESETVNVVNNGPTNNNTSGSGNNSNGGVASGAGGVGGRGDRGGSVRSGSVSTSASSFNSLNNDIIIIVTTINR